MKKTEVTDNITLVLLGIPNAKQSFRAGKPITTKSGKTFTPKYQPAKVRRTEQSLIVQIKSQLPHDFVPFDGAVRVEKLEFCFPPLKSSSKALLEMIRLMDDGLIMAEPIYKTTKPDLDNLEKMLWDSMNGIVFIDDGQICEKKHIIKRFSMTPKIVVVIKGERIKR